MGEGEVMMFEEESPEVPRTEQSLRGVATALKALPGRWTLLGKYTGTPGAARQFAYMLVHRPDTIPGRSFGLGYETQVRRMVGEIRIYVRWIGP